MRNASTHGPQAINRLPDQMGELQPVMENRQGMDGTEVYEMEPLGHER